MSQKVFANHRELVCKAGSSKSIAAFPDVCLTPPTPPAGPIPVPYPNTAMCGDLADGSTTVMIAGKPVFKGDKSFMKTSTGDEGSTPSQGKGIVTHQNKGKAYFISFSMDVLIEGEKACRALDMTTHNHGSKPPNTPPMVHIGDVDIPDAGGAGKRECKDQDKEADEKCKNAPQLKSKSGRDIGRDCSKSPGCAEARACVLKSKKDDRTFCCAPNRTGHHLIEVHCCSPAGKRGKPLDASFKDYDEQEAPCVCVNASRFKEHHGICHAVQGKLEEAYREQGKKPLQVWKGMGERGSDAESHWTYKQARESGVMAHFLAFPHCNPQCVREQLDDYHQKKRGFADDKPMRSDSTTRGAGTLTKQQESTVKSQTHSIQGNTSAESL
jgi:hypothetical protein